MQYVRIDKIDNKPVIMKVKWWLNTSMPVFVTKGPRLLTWFNFNPNMEK